MKAPHRCQETTAFDLCGNPGRLSKSFWNGIVRPAGHRITVDRGDGTSNPLEFDQYGFIELVKEYNATGRYKIVVSGDINQITSLKSYYCEGVFDSINVSGLKSLGSVRPERTNPESRSASPGPAIVDLLYPRFFMTIVI